MNGDDGPVISDDDRLVAAPSLCGTLAVGYTDTARPFATLDNHSPVQAVAFDPGLDQLAVGSLDGSVGLVDAATGTRVQELLGHSRWITGLAYGPQGTYVAATSDDDTIRLWDAATDQTLQVDHDFSFTYAPYITSDGRYLIDNNQVGLVTVWAACPDCEDSTALLQAFGRRCGHPPHPHRTGPGGRRRLMSGQLHSWTTIPRPVKIRNVGTIERTEMHG